MAYMVSSTSISAFLKAWNGSRQLQARALGGDIVWSKKALTKPCCGKLSGTVSGNDCTASSISEHLSDFRNCCGDQSDCDYPSKRDAEGATTTIVVK